MNNKPKPMKPIKAWALVRDGYLTIDPMHFRGFLIYPSRRLAKSAVKFNESIVRVEIREIPYAQKSH